MDNIGYLTDHQFAPYGKPDSAAFCLYVGKGAHRKNMGLLDRTGTHHAMEQPFQRMEDDLRRE